MENITSFEKFSRRVKAYRLGKTSIVKPHSQVSITGATQIAIPSQSLTPSLLSLNKKTKLNYLLKFRGKELIEKTFRALNKPIPHSEIIEILFKLFEKKDYTRSEQINFIKTHTQSSSKINGLWGRLLYAKVNRFIFRKKSSKNEILEAIFKESPSLIFEENSRSIMKLESNLKIFKNEKINYENRLAHIAKEIDTIKNSVEETKKVHEKTIQAIQGAQMLHNELDLKIDNILNLSKEENQKVRDDLKYISKQSEIKFKSLEVKNNSFSEKFDSITLSNKNLKEFIRKLEKDIDTALFFDAALLRVNSLELGTSNRLIKDLIWLAQNRVERMDAFLSIFYDKSRCDFHVDRYKFSEKFIKGVVLDAASGTGYGTNIISKQELVERAIGIDVDRKTIEYAQKYHANKKTEFLIADAKALPFPDEIFDSIVSFETIEHLEHPQKLLEEFYRVLKKNGILVISTPNKWGLKTNPYHKTDYDLPKFEEDLKYKFKIEEIYNQNSGTPNRLENHHQARGTTRTTPETEHLAECYIAICKKG